MEKKDNGACEKRLGRRIFSLDFVYLTKKNEKNKVKMWNFCSSIPF